VKKNGHKIFLKNIFRMVKPLTGGLGRRKLCATIYRWLKPPQSYMNFLLKKQTR
jgi:hypothetical protein